MSRDSIEARIAVVETHIVEIKNSNRELSAAVRKHMDDEADDRKHLEVRLKQMEDSFNKKWNFIGGMVSAFSIIWGIGYVITQIYFKLKGQ